MLLRAAQRGAARGSRWLLGELQGAGKAGERLLCSPAEPRPMWRLAGRPDSLARSIVTSWQPMQKTYLDKRAEAAEKSVSLSAEARGDSKQHGEPREELANVSHEIRKALQTAEAEGGVDAIFQVVEQFGEGAEFSEKEVATAFCQLAKVTAGQSLVGQEMASRVHNHPRFQNLVDMALATSCKMTNEELTEILASAGRLQFDDQMLLDTLAKRLFLGIPSLSPAQLVDVVEGLQSADHSPGKALFDELKARADQLTGQLSPEQKSKLERAWQHFGYSF